MRSVSGSSGPPSGGIPAPLRSIGTALANATAYTDTTAVQSRRTAIASSLSTLPAIRRRAPVTVGPPPRAASGSDRPGGDAAVRTAGRLDLDG